MSIDPTPPHGQGNHLNSFVTKQPCLKALVIFVVVIGAITLVTGVLALLASKGVLPNSVNSIMHLAKIGEVNSSLMIGGGFALSALGIVAWTCLLRKQTAQMI